MGVNNSKQRQEQFDKNQKEDKLRSVLINAQKELGKAQKELGKAENELKEDEIRLQSAINPVIEQQRGEDDINTSKQSVLAQTIIVNQKKNLVLEAETKVRIAKENLNNSQNTNTSNSNEDTRNIIGDNTKIGGNNKNKPSIIVKKEILGKERCIYKKTGDRKEYVKYKGNLITVKDYKKIIKARNNKKI
jgi:hypothetical protein